MERLKDTPGNGDLHILGDLHSSMERLKVSVYPGQAASTAAIYIPVWRD